MLIIVLSTFVKWLTLNPPAGSEWKVLGGMSDSQ